MLDGFVEDNYFVAMWNVSVANETIEFGLEQVRPRRAAHDGPRPR